MTIGRQGGQPGILNRTARREMIERLKGRILQAECLVHGIVEIAADSCGANSGRLGLKVEDLADDSGLPEQAAVKPGAMPPQASFELREHAQ